MRTMPAVENAATRFNAKTVTRRRGLDSLFGEKPVGMRHAEVQVVAEYGPADVTAARPYSEDEADCLL